MSLRSEIIPYIDGNGLVTPNLAPVPPARGSDNGVCFTSEYYIYLKLNNEIKDLREETLMCAEYGNKIVSCMLEAGLVSRAPGDKGVQPPDDYLAIMAACSQLSHPTIAEDILDYGLKHKGSYNNTNPGIWTKESFLWRQPQLIAAAYAASRRSQWNPIVKLLNLYAAICILVGNINDPIDQVDGRRLTFLLIKAMEPVSIVCRMAASVWESRMKKTYGPEFMQEICKIYYKDNHPFGRYAKYD